MLILKKVDADFGRKQHLADLPLISRKMSVWNYPISTNNEIALVYPLFIGGNDYHHFFVKGALYSALTFLDKTDLRDRGIPIYFMIEDTDYEELLPYFETAGVKKEFILPFQSNSTVDIFKVIDALFATELRKYKRLFRIDTDVYARPQKTTPIVDKLLWNTKQYEVALLEYYQHYHGTMWKPRYEELEKLDALSKFPVISATPQKELIKRFIAPASETTNQNLRTYPITWLIGYSNEFLSQIQEPYQKIATFANEHYIRNDHDFIVDEDILTILFTEFQTKFYDLSNEISYKTYFVEEHEPCREITVFNHIYSCNAEDLPEYNLWKEQWIAEVNETINRHIK